MINKKNGIIIVEDNEDDVILIQRVIAKNWSEIPYQVFRTGESAVAYMTNSGSSPGKSNNPLPFLVVLDLMLPKMDGFKVLEELRGCNHLLKTPIIIFSSSNIQSDIKKCYHLGANSYIQKPIDFSIYSDTLGKMMEYWINFNLAPEKDDRQS